MGHSSKLMGCAVVLSAGALLTPSLASAYNITADTFIDSTSLGTPGPASGPNPGYNPAVTAGGSDADSYGDDGKVKAVAGNYNSGSYPSDAAHVLFLLPTSFWTALGNARTVTSAVVSYYPFTQRLNPSDGLGHGNMELHPLTHSFTVGNGQQSNSVNVEVPSTTGGATWDSFDGVNSDSWATPGGDYDNTAGDFVNISNTSLPTASSGVTSGPFTWNITSLINNPVTRLELYNYGALIKVSNESNEPDYSTTGTMVNDFVSFFSADDQNTSGNSYTKDPNAAYLPTVSLSVPEPASAATLALGLLAFRRRRSVR